MDYAADPAEIEVAVSGMEAVRVSLTVSHGIGPEVQGPLGTVAIGGLGTSTLLTLLMLPTLYAWLEPRRRRPQGVEATQDEPERILQPT